ncbi:MAG: hypothetical protein FJZ86_01310 [Chloroflexi bacterium]|nr:hypothetical protein [Chloroflexota bacterium]
MGRASYDKRALIHYRLERSCEALNDAQLMLEQNGSPAARKLMSLRAAALALWRRGNLLLS